MLRVKKSEWTTAYVAPKYKYKNRINGVLKFVGIHPFVQKIFKKYCYNVSQTGVSDTNCIHFFVICWTPCIACFVSSHSVY